MLRIRGERMKRKIVVKIDCEETVCGICDLAQGDIFQCDLYRKEELEWNDELADFERCIECLEAEVKE